jgi:hypothetical protein
VDKVRVADDLGTEVFFIIKEDTSPEKVYVNCHDEVQDDPIFKAIVKSGELFPKMLLAMPHRKGYKGPPQTPKLIPPKFIKIVSIEPYGNSIATARNFAIKTALRYNIPYLAFVDDDVRARESVLPLLFNHLMGGLDIVSGTYPLKRPPLQMNVLVQFESEPKRYLTAEDIKPDRAIRSGVQLPALGLSVMKTEVFKRLAPPYCKELIGLTGETLFTEDEYLFKRLLALEPPVRIAVDCSLDAHAAHIDTNGKAWVHPQWTPSSSC